jgi:hypothetical protein
MGKGTRAAKGSLAAIFVAAGGAAIPTQAGAEANTNQANVDGVIASYFGPLGLEPSFQQYMKFQSGFENFQKWYKASPSVAVQGVNKFSNLNDVAPPPGFGETPE